MQTIAIVHTETRMRRPARPPGTKLKPERIQKELATMPGWELLPGGKSIGRIFQFDSERAAATYAAFVSASAGDAGQPVRLQVAGSEVEVKLFSPLRRNGSLGDLTMYVIDFARKLG
jgi:pterin-4a-carbinolamine dehydratase